MAKKFTKVLCALLAFVMCLGTVPAFAIEATPELTAEERAALWPIKKTATGLDENDQTDVSLTVPGIVEGNIDVVFILGGGMTANMETIESAISVFKPAMESGKATVRMGLISLEKGKEIILDLNSDEAVLDPDTYVDFVTEKFNSINDLPYGSTNLHSQMLEAQKMLAKETRAKADNKYVFVLATGRTYWFDDANGEQATIVNKVNGTYYWGDYLWRSQRCGHTSLYMLPDRYNNSYEAFFADVEKWVAADGDKYVYTPHFDVNDYSAYVTWEQNNNKDLRALGIAGSRFGNGIVNPKPTADNFITGVEAAIGSENNPQNALNYERAHYECVQVWKQMIDAGYNCYSICSENPNYQNGSEYIKQGAGYTGTSTTQLGHSFMNYLAKLAGQEFAPTVWDYERDAEGNFVSANPVLQENFFDSVREEMLFTTSIDTTVVDYIGKNENGDFEFITEIDGKYDHIKLVVGGIEYITEKADVAKHIDESGEVAKFSYEFYSDIWNTEPTFWLDYFYGDGETTERFVWTFGENVSMENLATLTYKLQLTEKQEEAGEYTVPTNISATLYPVFSNGQKGDPMLFPVPSVTYSVVPYDVDIVLALGAGIAQYDNTYNSIVSLVEDLVNNGIKVKLGFVAVEHYTEKAMDLTLLDKDNYEKVIQAGLDTIQNMPAGPTNLEGVIAEAHAMLTAESEEHIPAANKFFYVIATGRTYCFDDAYGNPATTLNSVKIKGDTYYYWGHYAWQSQRGRHTSLYMIPDKYNDNFSAYWEDVVAMNEADIVAGDEKGNGKYDYTMPGDYSESDWYVGTEGFFTNNSTDAKAKGLGSSRYGWIINGLTNEKVDAIGSGVNPGHAMAYDRGQYEAWKAYTAMQKDGINCYAICSESPSYQNGSPYIQVAKYTGTSTIQVGHSFMNFLNGGEATLLFQMTDKNGNYKMAENFFNETYRIEIENLVESNAQALGSSTLSLRSSAANGEVASVEVDAEGDALTYTWYYKSNESDEFTLSSFTGADFRAVMNSDYDGMQVYCVITDQYGNSTTTEVVTLNLDK